MMGRMTRALERVPQAFMFRAPSLIIGIVIVQRLFALALVRLDFEKRWYLVTNRSLRVREGVVKLREMTITFANIQNISISQGPIQRLLGIADLRVDTAGRRLEEEGESGRGKPARRSFPRSEQRRRDPRGNQHAPARAEGFRTW